MEPSIQLDIILNPRLEALVVLLDRTDLAKEVALDGPLKLGALVLSLF